MSNIPPPPPRSPRHGPPPPPPPPGAADYDAPTSGARKPVWPWILVGCLVLGLVGVAGAGLLLFGLLTPVTSSVSEIVVSEMKDMAQFPPGLGLAADVPVYPGATALDDGPPEASVDVTISPEEGVNVDVGGTVKVKVSPDEGVDVRVGEAVRARINEEDGVAVLITAAKFVTADAPQDVIEWYQAELPGHGWAEQSIETVNEDRLGTFAKDTRTVTIGCRPQDDGQTLLTISERHSSPDPGRRPY